MDTSSHSIEAELQKLSLEVERALTEKRIMEFHRLLKQRSSLLKRYGTSSSVSPEQVRFHLEKSRQWLASAVLCAASIRQKAEECRAARSAADALGRTYLCRPGHSGVVYQNNA